ncbi:hypothetical protein NDU88_000536 [Pleurodeles waltl]|uniref:Uncharacterized protein n=1 Tax=Pleurodeles waltl TaxID=8319 RepID=A0AAV7S4W5_PLEWA|nr:hypothetical protein NDU88_000536 [Pleurodeles waltl]
MPAAEAGPPRELRPTFHVCWLAFTSADCPSAQPSPTLCTWAAVGHCLSSTPSGLLTAPGPQPGRVLDEKMHQSDIPVAAAHVAFGLSVQPSAAPRPHYSRSARQALSMSTTDNGGPFQDSSTSPRHPRVSLAHRAQLASTLTEAEESLLNVPERYSPPALQPTASSRLRLQVKSRAASSSCNSAPEIRCPSTSTSTIGSRDQNKWRINTPIPQSLIEWWPFCGQAKPSPCIRKVDKVGFKIT